MNKTELLEVINNILNIQTSVCEYLNSDAFIDFIKFTVSFVDEKHIVVHPFLYFQN